MMMKSPVLLVTIFGLTAPLFGFQASSSATPPADENVTFRSDVSLVRVDVQVLDRDNRAISGLRIEDFVLREEGRRREIRNFAREDMPLDVLMVFDVSASMRPHVQRIASAAHSALNVLADQDRVGIMVFDRSSRVRMPFRADRSEVERQLDRMMRDEGFRGGTDITRAMLDAAEYVRRNGRKDARRAIVILTDDQTEFDRSEQQVLRELDRADAVMSALIAPDAMGNRNYGGNGRYPNDPNDPNGQNYPNGRGQQRGGWGGPSLGGGLGGIILGGGGGGRGRGGMGGPQRGGGMGGSRTHSAGTAEIAQQSGGDSLPVDDASALETTLSRLRQRYALHFLVPPGAMSGQERRIDVALSDTARRRYPDAELRFRRTYNSPTTVSGTDVPAEVTSNGSDRPDRISDRTSDRVGSATSVDDSTAPRRRRAISEPDGPRGAVADKPVDPADAPPTGGWRRVKPGEVPPPIPQPRPQPQQ